ncbi:MAG: hypothetical protein LBQ80_01325 [Clostridium sp.]|jgi:YbbR domain-containing protein|nr:hypothetical protein [Clostridium sp.]
MKKGVRLRKLISSNPFLLLLSFVLAFSIWLGVTVSVAPEEEIVLAHVPVSIELTDAIKELNLEAFTSPDGVFVDVTIKGKRYVLNEIGSEQISVKAQTSTVGSAGLKTLRLSATSQSSKDFEIVRLSQQEISVLFDERKEQEFQLETVVVGVDGKTIKDLQEVAPKGYIVDHELLSGSSVTLSGPSSELARVKTVTATVQLTKQLTDTTPFTAALALQTADGATAQYVTIQTEEEVTMTIPVYKEVSLPLTVDWLNAPAAYTEKPLSFSISPQKAKFGISESLIGDVDSVSVGTVDFAKLPAGKKTVFKFPAVELPQYKLLSGEESFSVTVDTSGTVSKSFAVPHQNVQLQNAESGMVAQISPGSLDSVTVAGSPESIAKLTGSDIYAEADLDSVKVQNGSATTAVRLFVKGYNDCWVIGSYKIVLTVTMEQSTVSGE